MSLKVRADLRDMYGNVSSGSIGAIQRRLLMAGTQWCQKVFRRTYAGSRRSDATDEDGNGYVNVLVANKLVPGTSGLLNFATLANV